jgi:phosphatidylglycerophosphatase A
LVIYAAVRWTDNVIIEGGVVLAALVIGIWSADVVEKHMGKDPGAVVIDEVLGMLVTLAFLDVTPLGAAVGFFIFRALDVIKPYPAGRLEHLQGGPGVMLDDAVAGVYSNVALRVLIAMFPGALA